MENITLVLTAEEARRVSTALLMRSLEFRKPSVEAEDELDRKINRQVAEKYVAIYDLVRTAMGEKVA